jgi:ABC-type multidrug transport system fused ATPase/permease subunit
MKYINKKTKWNFEDHRTFDLFNVYNNLAGLLISLILLILSFYLISKIISNSFIANSIIGSIFIFLPILIIYLLSALSVAHYIGGFYKAIEKYICSSNIKTFGQDFFCKENLKEYFFCFLGK